MPQLDLSLLCTMYFESIALVLVVLITGGMRDGLLDSSSVELFDPFTGAACELPSLPSDKTHHTQDGPLLCGASWTGFQDVGVA